MKFVLMTSAMLALTQPMTLRQKSQAAEKITTTIKCDGGTWKEDVDWTLICSDGEVAFGGAPYDKQFTAEKGATCTLDMSDSFGDGWTGNNWTGFGRTYTIKGAKKQKSVNFVVGGGSSKASVTDVMDKEAAAIGTAPVNATSVAPPAPTAPVP